MTNDLRVTADEFDRLKRESEQPPRSADPKLIEFFKMMKGKVIHR